jgi:hypothetical protein
VVASGVLMLAQPASATVALTSDFIQLPIDDAGW